MPKPEKTTGFICLHRSIRDHWIYEDAVKFKWWCDILMECNHSDRKVSIKFELIDCKRGQTLNSLNTWSKMWRVDVSTIRRFFVLLEKDGMITTENMKKTTRLTVCNYDNYNGNRHATQSQHNSDTIATQSRRNTNNNANNDNNVNNDKEGIDGAYGEKERDEFLKFEKWIAENAKRVGQMKEPFTIKQFLTLKEKYSVPRITAMLAEMHNHQPLLRKTSAYLTILKWLKKEDDAAHPKTPIVRLDNNKPGTSEARLQTARNW
jgi:DNA-binding transcriptional regulator YhcF (GntR family)